MFFYPVGLAIIVSLSQFASLAVGDDRSGDLERLVEQLSSPVYQTRERATIALVKLGPQALGRLSRAVVEGDPESATRAAKVMENIAVQGDETTALKVARVFMLLSNNGHPYLNTRCTGLRQQWKQARVNKTIARIEELGGQVTGLGANQIIWLGDSELTVSPQPADSPNAIDVVLEDRPPHPPQQLLEQVELILAATAEATERAFEDEITRDVAATVPPASNGDAPDVQMIVDGGRGMIIERAAVGGRIVVLGGGVFGEVGPQAGSPDSLHMVTLGENWKGDDGDATLLKLIPGLQSVQLQRIGVSDRLLSVLASIPDLRAVALEKTHYELAGLQDFARRRPDINLSVVGRAFLGVTGLNQQGDDGCVIETVVDSAAAAAAGLRPGDLVQKVDEHPISNFQSLVFVIASHDVGDEVTIHFERAGRPQSAVVKLGIRDDLIPLR